MITGERDERIILALNKFRNIADLSVKLDLGCVSEDDINKEEVLRGLMNARMVLSLYIDDLIDLAQDIFSTCDSLGGEYSKFLYSVIDLKNDLRVAKEKCGILSLIRDEISRSAEINIDSFRDDIASKKTEMDKYRDQFKKFE